MIEDWHNKKILILGFGREGQATLRFLKHRWPALEVAVADQKERAGLNADEKKLLKPLGRERQFFGKKYLDKLKQFDVVIKSPGINPRQKQINEAKKTGVIFTSATNLFFQARKGRVIAVTGSKGKSTTASLIHAVLKKAGQDVQLIGNIGKPALDFLTKDSPETIYVFEMSSYQLEDFQGGADLAVFVSFFPEHLDYHQDLDSYFEAKMRLAAIPKPGFKVIYNAAQERLKSYFTSYAAAFRGEVKVIPFNDNVSSKIVSENGFLVARDRGKTVIREDQIKLKGRHNLENILAVAKVAREMGINHDVLAAALYEFIPLEHRLEQVGEYKEILFYNDAISTTPESTMAAIEALERKKHIGTLIAGGLDRGYDFHLLAKKILENKIDNLILLPQTGIRIEQALNSLISGKSSFLPVLIHCQSMPACVKIAYEVTAKGDICLLSCASPSYNLFKNFEERGRLFKESVRNLAIC